MRCEYCNKDVTKNKLLLEEEGFIVETDSLNKELSIVFRSSDELIYKELFIPMEYCGKCGTRLGEGNE